jgi:hypothetical protein
MKRKQTLPVISILFGSFVWLAPMLIAQAQTPAVQINHV